MKTQDFWTPRQMSVELGWSYQGVLRWCRKLGVPYLHEGNGGRGRQTMVIDKTTRENLLYIHSLSLGERLSLMRHPKAFPLVYPAAWDRRPKGFKIPKEEN